MKQSICLLGNFDDDFEEGLVKISSKLKQWMNKKYNVQINKPSISCSIYNIHCSGFLEGVKYKKLKGKKIYSLHSEINLNFWKEILDFVQFYRYFVSNKQDAYPAWERFSKTMFRLTSAALPLFIKRSFLKNMDVIIAPNKSIANDLLLKQCTIVHHGIDCNKYKNIKNKKNKKNKKIKVAYFGHPSTNKGMLEVIKAFSKITDTNIEKHLCLTVLNDKIKKTIKKFDKSIIIHGKTKNIINAYNKMDIIVLPYRHSGGAIATPLVLLEAMACQRAIITTGIPTLKEICGNTVKYVKPYSVKGIKTAIMHLAKNPTLRKDIGKKARRQVVDNYNQEKMFKGYQKIFNSILTKK
jgi:glycosyltransferase involved in cell wall biosynthesis